MKYPIMLLLVLGFTGVAQAEDFNYNFISASYGVMDFDDLNVDGDAYSIGASFEAGENFHVFGEYLGSNLDFGIDASQFSVGFGFNTPISEAIDVVAQLSYERVEVDLPGFGSADDDGFGLLVGLRAAVSESVELNAGIKYVDLDDSGDTTGFGAGFLFNLTDNFALGVNGTWDDDVSVYSLNGRVYFD